MKKICVGIVGYGNLGHAVENLLINSNYELLGIFSRRKITSDYKTPCFSMKEIANFENKIDIMILCGGSDKDLLTQSPTILKRFNIINTFDTHKLVKSEKQRLEKIAKNNKKYAIICCGWDPGLFSQARIIFNAVSNQKSANFWGKGVSMGHSNALKKITNVKNAIAYTIPNEKSLSHTRKVFFVADLKHHKQIINDVFANKKYFSDFPTKIKFISQKNFDKHHSARPHAGKVVNKFLQNGKQNQLEFSVKMQDNALFTASIVVAYLKTFEKLQKFLDFGAYTLPEIPISFLDENFMDLI